MTKLDLVALAHDAGYAWAMLLGASSTSWHVDPIIATLDERDPLRAVHLHARLELAWHQGRLLYDFLFKSGGDNLSVLPFLSGAAITDWNKRSDLMADFLCPSIHKAVERGGRANKKHFHLTAVRLHDHIGLAGYDTVRDELR